MELDLHPEVQALAMGEVAGEVITQTPKLEPARKLGGRRDLANPFLFF